MKVLIEVESGSSEKGLYNEKTFELIGTRSILLPYPYPYGFIIGTKGDDGECLDCYVLTDNKLKAGSIIECEPQGLLEFFEGSEIDHKILATLPNEVMNIDEKLLEGLKTFTYGVFKAFPEIDIKVGQLLSREKAIAFVNEYKG